MTLDLGKLVLRIGIAGLMLPHGYAKLQLWLDHGINARFADPLGIGEIATIILAIIAELICPVLVIIGFKTRLAAILPAATMLIAVLVIHINDPWANTIKMAKTRSQSSSYLLFDPFLFITAPIFCLLFEPFNYLKTDIL